MNKINNASEFPKRYFGLHMSEGTALYQISPEETFMILVKEDTIRKMDASFEGKPVYVQHVDKVDVANVEKADGYVVKSFYNKADGQHWVEFIVVTDAAHEAIKNGWVLSNSYVYTKTSDSGRWQGMDYDKEILEASYEHLAIVPDPRYKQSIVMTPEDFKSYNENKELELKQLSNSMQGAKPMLRFFKKQKVDNAADLDGMMVRLPITGREVELSVIINEADQEPPKYVDMEKGIVNIEGADVGVKTLVECYNSMKKNEADKAAKEKEEAEAKEKAKNEEDAAKGKESAENAADVHVDVDSHKDGQEEEEDNMQNNSDDHFGKLMNAGFDTSKGNFKIIETSADRLARGQSLYGSKK